VIRPYAAGDEAAVLALNAHCVPEVGPMDADKLSYFAREAPYFVVIDVDDGIVGFLVLLTEESTGYTSPNYRWFRERHSSFAYVDRVAVGAEHRGQGLGQRFYRDAEAFAVGSGRRLLCAEVNTVPDNPASHRFHCRFGFTAVARFKPYGPDEEVGMYEKPLVAPG